MSKNSNFRYGKYEFPVPLSIEIQASEFVPTFHARGIKEQIEETSSAYHRLQEHFLQPTTPFRPKLTRKNIGLFQRKGDLSNGDGSISRSAKRKYTDVSTVVYPTEEVDARYNMIDETEYNTTPKISKQSKTHDETSIEKTPCGDRVSKFLSSIADKTLSILSTPTLERKYPPYILNTNLPHAHAKNSECLQQNSPFTPKPSILKVSKVSSKRKIKEAEEPCNENTLDTIVSESDQAATNEDGNDSSSVKMLDQDWLTKTGNQSVHNHNRSRESTPGKSLRFNVPKRLPPQMAHLDEDMKRTGIEYLEVKSRDSSKIDDAFDESQKSVPAAETIQENLESSSHINDVDSEDQTLPKGETQIFVHEEDYNRQQLLNIDLPNTKTDMQCPSWSKDASGEDVVAIEALDDEKDLVGTLDNSPTTAKMSQAADRDNSHSESFITTEVQIGAMQDITSTSILHDISVYQSNEKESAKDDVVTTNTIQTMAQEKLASQQIAQDSIDPAEIHIFDIQHEKEKSLAISDISVYNPKVIDEEEILQNATVISDMAHEAYSEPSEDHYRPTDTNTSFISPLSHADMSVYEPELNKTNLNETAIRGMAAEACLQDENLCQTLEKDTISHQAMNILDTSVCSPSGEKEGKSNVVSTIEHAKEDFDTMVQDPDHSEDSEDKDRCKTGEMDISVSENTIDRVSPDPEVTLNIPKVEYPSVNRASPEAIQKSEYVSNEYELKSDYPKQQLDYSSDQNPDVSVYNRDAQKSPSTNVSFLTSLAIKNVKVDKAKLNAAQNLQVPLFEFSVPYEASPAIAAKKRHLSKSEIDISTSSPSFVFANPVSATEYKMSSTYISAVQGGDQRNTNIEDSNLNKTADNIPITRQNHQFIDAKSPQHVLSTESGTCNNLSGQTEKSFIFSPPLENLNPETLISEDITVFHGWNKDDSRSKQNKDGAPRFDFTPAESVLPSEVDLISADEEPSTKQNLHSLGTNTPPKNLNDVAGSTIFTQINAADQTKNNDVTKNSHLDATEIGVPPSEDGQISDRVSIETSSELTSFSPSATKELKNEEPDHLIDVSIKGDAQKGNVYLAHMIMSMH